MELQTAEKPSEKRVTFSFTAFAFDSLNEINITVLASSDKWNGTILSMWSYHTNSRIVSVGEDAENEVNPTTETHFINLVYLG